MSSHAAPPAPLASLWRALTTTKTTPKHRKEKDQ